MTEFIDLIHRRRSIRSFTDRPIADEDLKTILAAAMTAPSAMNKQPWRFIVVTNGEKKDAVIKFSPYATMTKQSPISILVCGDKNVSFQGYYAMDYAAAIQNLMLAATALGIGTVWTGVGVTGHDDQRISEFRKLFELPSNIEPIGYIILGYSNEKFSKKNYFDDSKIHYNKW